MKQRDYFKLNDGEKIIGGSDNFSIVLDRGGFLLTNQRVIKVDRSMLGGKSNVHSFNLVNLDSVQMVAKKSYFWVVISAISILFTLTGKNSKEIMLGLILGVVFAGLYYISRTKQIVLSSGNSKMSLNVSPMAHDQIQEMIFAIEEAKQTIINKAQNKVYDTDKPIGINNRLKELNKIFNDGLITKEEFDKKRAALLEKL